MTDQFVNRRKHVRIYRNFVLFVYPKDRANKAFELSQVNNISQGGINFSTTTKLTPGDEIVIELKTPFIDDKVTLDGKVLDVRAKIPNLIYENRVQFTTVTPEAADVLVKIESYSEKQS